MCSSKFPCLWLHLLKMQEISWNALRPHRGNDVHAPVVNVINHTIGCNEKFPLDINQRKKPYG